MKRLLGLLLVMGVTGCGGGDPVATLEKLKAPIARKEQGEVVGVCLGGTEINDAVMAHLKGLTNLENVSLVGPQITNAGLLNLSGLTNLRHLELETPRTLGSRTYRCRCGPLEGADET